MGGVLAGLAASVIWTNGHLLQECQSPKSSSMLPSDELAAAIKSRASEINSIAGGGDGTKQLLMQAVLMLSLWQVPVGDYLNDATTIVGFAFAQGPSDQSGRPTPGQTNRGLAWSVAALVREFVAAGRPRPKIMLQWEIAQLLLETHGIKADVVATVDTSGNYLSTFGVMEQFAATSGLLKNR